MINDTKTFFKNKHLEKPSFSLRKKKIILKNYLFKNFLQHIFICWEETVKRFLKMAVVSWYRLYALLIYNRL